MKDEAKGTTLLNGACKNVIYLFPNSMAMSDSKMVANVHEYTSIDGWHKRLGHPSIKVVQNLVHHFSLPLSTYKISSLCNSCSNNKAHQQPFGTTTSL